MIDLSIFFLIKNKINKLKKKNNKQMDFLD